MNTLILTEANLYPYCSRTHITYTFNLQKDSEQLNIDFEYYPKILKDPVKSKELIINGLNLYADKKRCLLTEKWEQFLPLKNLLTISIDDSDKFRGCAHRHSPKQNLVISHEKASPGFIPGMLKKGLWKVTISVHAVVTDNCHYKLHVWEGAKAND